MSNVKPGDRAIVIQAMNPENIGKIVLVVQEFTRGETLNGFPVVPPKLPEPIWLIESLGGPLVMALIIAPSVKSSHGLAIAPDAFLRRLDPPEEEQTGSDERLSAPVKDSQAVEVHS